MDQPITRAEHEEFKRRLEEENSRPDRRIALLEESVSKMGALSTSVEKLALSMNNNSVKHIPLDVLDKLCTVLDCQPADLLEFVPDENEKSPDA